MIGFDPTFFDPSRNKNAVDFFKAIAVSLGVTTNYLSFTPFAKQGNFGIGGASDQYFNIANAALGPRSVAQIVTDNDKFILYGDLFLKIYATSAIAGLMQFSLTSGPNNALTSYLVYSENPIAGATNPINNNQTYNFSGFPFNYLRMQLAAAGTADCEYMFSGILVRF